ncbi:class I SAM-dependent RNA methyltransferase [Gulosibacter molinativorax]|uniref:Class I SAM-dependent RNA methyltransferase n=1 Tax=Gulosibacter molinativorax TaxID=256821 RepID=A0ABT7C842_9MICO|nr:TRAM domain-containing protein [Gulosibacter molinativorax]MDJ1371332.1 class I SAM-dependent RNA methyltransferase [Gulosibacter molinativorax]QUY63604.1 Putative RNA methyltransferase [Gulosibacter molinativorax]
MTEPTASSPELTEGDIVELTVGEVAHGGIFVARHDSGRVVFVSDALPGERVRAEISEVKKRFARAETLEVLDASSERLEHVWPEADVSRAPDDRPGGAEFGHTSVAFGRELKRRVLADALARFGGVEPEFEVSSLGNDDETRGTGWRTRVTLHVDDDGRVGPFAARSHRVVDVRSLPLAFPDIDELAQQIIAKGHRGPGRIDFVAPADFEVRMRARVKGASTRKPELLRERVGEREFAVSEDGFWQVHRLAAVTLYDAVQDAIDRSRFDVSAQHFDLFGGVGLLGAAVAELAGKDARVESVEDAKEATELALTNLAEWGGATAKTGRVDRYLHGLLDSGADALAAARAGTVVLDPPRSGAKADVTEPLAELAPAQIVYVACDPVALGRDTGLLRERGYELTRLRSYDLFPNTHHVEAVATFVRA